MGNWVSKMRMKVKLAAPKGVTLSNSEAKLLLKEQKEVIKTLESDSRGIERAKDGFYIKLDDSISEASLALNAARGTYKRTKNPILKRDWARRMVIADKTVNELIQTKRRTELVLDKLRMVAGDIKLELIAAEARAAETKMYVDAGDTLRLVGDRLIKARIKAKPLKIEYNNLEVGIETAMGLVSEMHDDEIIKEAEAMIENEL